MKNNRTVRGVKRLLAVQLLVCLLLTMLAFLSYGLETATSVLLGGLTAYIPSLIFASKMFQYQGARAAKHIVKSFYIGECLKLFSTVLLFSLVFILYGKIVPLAFFLTYIAMLLTHWFSSIIIGYKQNKLDSN